MGSFMLAVSMEPPAPPLLKQQIRPTCFPVVTLPETFKRILLGKHQDQRFFLCPKVKAEEARDSAVIFNGLAADS